MNGTGVPFVPLARPRTSGPRNPETTRRTMKRPVYLALCLLALGGVTAAQAQLRRPGVVHIDREDRDESQLVKEEGAIYLQDLVEDEVRVRITKAASIYSTLQADRWLGKLKTDQSGELLAVSDKAYRVRARARQGQVAGWVSKAAVEGLPDDFEKNLREYYERYRIVTDLIEKHQVALGMTIDEVIASIGPPDRRTSKITREGRTDSLEFISYERVPHTTVTYDHFGRSVPTTQYVEVESGRVTIEFVDNTVTSIEESEGTDLSRARRVVPPPVVLF